MQILLHVLLCKPYIDTIKKCQNVAEQQKRE
ncbi:transcriptional regulator [Zymobacter palmae]|uniref:Transcriptional regulator n=1 Tax=Zymobacter palmae TaxID=33074 RepID=A0A348HGQ7_9GAMM|nr:transcriptional regulator [Zymobacter palmae]